MSARKWALSFFYEIWFSILRSTTVCALESIIGNLFVLPRFSFFRSKQKMLPSYEWTHVPGEPWIFESRCTHTHNIRLCILFDRVKLSGSVGLVKMWPSHAKSWMGRSTVNSGLKFRLQISRPFPLLYAARASWSSQRRRLRVNWQAAKMAGILKNGHPFANLNPAQSL